MGARWGGCMVFAAACTSASPSSNDGVVGTVVYTDASTSNVRVRDLGTGRDTLIDPGQFGNVSIAPDARHFMYAGADQLPKLADRSGTVRRLPGSGFMGAVNWVSQTVVTYPVSGGSMLLPNLDGASRQLDNTVAISPDHTLVANVDAQGNVDLENLDGTGHRILSPSIAPTSPYPMEAMLGFTPDQRAVLVQDTSTAPSAIHIIAIADGSSIDVPDASVGGTPFGAPRFVGASTFSSDGSEVLLQSTTALVAVTLATGAKRTIAAFDPKESSGGAVFLDDQHVLWLRVDDHSMGDAGSFSVSLHVAGPSPTDDVVVDSPAIDNLYIPTIAVSPEGFIALASDVVLVRTDGTVVVRNDSDGTDVLADDVLGVTPDNKGVITSARSGAVRYFGVDGTTRLILTTATGGGGLVAPFAAYTPAH